MKKVLCIVFWAALVLPTVVWLLVSRFVPAENRERRTYAAFPSLTAPAEFASGFEDWWSDRLPWKNQLTGLDAKIKVATRLQSNWMDYIGGLGVIFGKEDWLFYNGNTMESTINDYICNNLYSDAELERLAAGYQALADQYKDMGIRFLFFIPTNKEQVYPEFMPDDLVPQGEVSRTDQLVAYLREHTDVEVIYTKEALRAEKSDGYPLFYRYDSHWNNIGGFVGAQLIRQAVKGEYESPSTYTVGFVPEIASPHDLADIYGLGAEYDENGSWAVLDYKPEIDGQFTSEDTSLDAAYLSYASNAPDGRELMVVKDSFVYSMIGPLSKEFSQLTMISDSEMAKEYIEEHRPDIVVLEIVERQFYRAEHQFEELLD